MASILQQVVAYWHECIKAEDALEKDISIAVRSRAILYPFKSDPFIVGAQADLLKVDNDDRLRRFYEYVRTQALDVFYGYPLLCYRDDKNEKTLVAPLLVLRMRFSSSSDGLAILRDEPSASFGVQALTRLGARSEEIADFTSALPEALVNSTSPKDAIVRVIDIVQAHLDVPIAEELAPSALTGDRHLKSGDTGLYNKSMLFAGESTSYNMHLLSDLSELRRRNDLEQTALTFLTGAIATRNPSESPPILVFPCNEFQISALQRALRDDLTVVTGPPGTGKSQLIANLLVNILLRKESCLFVSHTNEAVSIVDTKLNESYRNILTRTGSREFRQELRSRFNELLAQRTHDTPTSRVEVDSLWNLLSRERSQLTLRDDLELKYSSDDAALRALATEETISRSWWRRLVMRLQIWSRRIGLRRLQRKLGKMPSLQRLEETIQEQQRRYFEVCHEYVKRTYVTSIIGDAGAVGAINAYLNSITDRRYGDTLDSQLFAKAARSLRVWCCTLKSLRASFPLQPRLFDYVIFDEASQVDLPSAAPALYRARRAIVVGDPMQLTHIATLTPTMDRRLAEETSIAEHREVYPSRVRYLDVSLYKAAEHSLKQLPILLANHYRSEDEIISLCNSVFYSGQLRIRTPSNNLELPEGVSPGVNWIDCAGRAERHPSGSRINEVEVKAVCNLVLDLMHRCEGTNLSIGVVAPYSRQQAAISEFLTARFSTKDIETHDLKVLTAHRFQGSEKDIMVFSVVLASAGNASDDRWYNINPQILNVALSRARRALYIVGDLAFCASRTGVLRKIASTYKALHTERRVAEESHHAKFDTIPERLLFQALASFDLDKQGYSLVLKPVVGRYTLDMALRGNEPIDIECDGTQHQIIDGLPVIEDVERDQYVVSRGWRVIRVPNYKILWDADQAAIDILESLPGARSGA